MCQGEKGVVSNVAGDSRLTGDNLSGAYESDAKIWLMLSEVCVKKSLRAQRMSPVAELATIQSGMAGESSEFWRIRLRCLPNSGESGYGAGRCRLCLAVE